MYLPVFEAEWNWHFRKLEKELQVRVGKKIQKILEHPQKRHLMAGARFFVGEVGQHRIIYRVFEQANEVRFYFVGGHKEYECWYKLQH
ncbi:Uncharacterised protein [uncultured archaeon]|nr:Uncharacterised protein [uncultured archaeon]